MTEQVEQKKRRPRKGGYACGDETRTKIIAAGLSVFGNLGFDGASTRMLAEKAGVNLPALQYYFDGKEGVYLACASYIADRFEVRIGPLVKRAEQELAKKNISREQLLDTLLEILDAYGDLFLSAGEIERWSLFVVREQMQPTKAFEIIYSRVMRLVSRTCTAIVGRLLKWPADDPRTFIRTLMLLGQIIIFRVGREAALRTLGWPNFEGDRMAIVKSTIREEVIAALGASRELGHRGKK